MEVWHIHVHVHKTGSGIDFYHSSYGKIALMSNISKMVRDAMMDSKGGQTGNHQWAFD